MLMNRLKLSSKLDSQASEADGDMDESASGPIVFAPVKRNSLLFTTIEGPGGKKMATG